VVVETCVFRLAGGVDDLAFLAADRRVQQEVIPNAAGFVRRTTARGDDGSWLVITLWADAAAADGQPAQDEFDALMEPGSVERRRFETLD
jgi:hypothetical protein